MLVSSKCESAGLAETKLFAHIQFENPQKIRSFSVRDKYEARVDLSIPSSNKA